MEINYEKFLEDVIQKLSRVTDEVDFLYPNTTKDGKYANAKGYEYGWTSGFYGGILWYMYLYTKDEKYLKLAKKASRHMDGGFSVFHTLSHDIGFQCLHTCVSDYMITGEEAAKIRALHGATILSGRFNPAGRYIRAWNDGEGVDPESDKTGYVIIDCLMNLPLLYWASDVTRDPRFAQIAKAHADTVCEHFIRPDGSSEHIVVFDSHTGKVIKKVMGQGYSEGSSWTRGQGWATYGMAMSYHYTGDEKYLNASKRVADYIINHINKEYMPIDYMQPEKPEYMDTSAAAISACGFLELVKYTEGSEKEKYMHGVRKLLEIVYKNCNFNKDEESIVQNCSERYHNTKMIHKPLIYADYYLLEALMRINGYECLFY